MLSETRKDKNKQVEMVCIEDLVPQNHVLRDIDQAIDFGFIYEMVRDLYCLDNGRPSIDPGGALQNCTHSIHLRHTLNAADH